MTPAFTYIDPRGKESGPFTEAELVSLATRGMIERDGLIQLEGAPTRWRADEIGWLRDALGIVNADAPAAVGPPTDAPAPAAPTTPPTNPWCIPPAATPTEAASCSRTTYILLAILPPFFGIFGIHNIVAGYTSIGIWQLVLSVFTIGGVCFGAIFPPCCCCGGLPLSLGLFAWVVYEAITITRDARGRLMA